MTPAQQERLEKIYGKYNALIKPLIADLEARYENAPIQLFNEVRAMYDHTARCYLPPSLVSKYGISIDEELSKAEDHACRLVLDCFKYLIVNLSDKEKDFTGRMNRVENLHLIGDGEFYAQYLKISAEALSNEREAKRNESYDKNLALDYYQKSYNAYTELELLIAQYAVSVESANRKKTYFSIFKVIIWVVSVIVASFITHFLLPWT